MKRKTAFCSPLVTCRDASLQLVAILFLFLIHTVVHSQSTIYARSFVTHDSILLRWAPANVNVWKSGNTNGYIIERFTTDQYFDLSGTDPIGKGTQLTTSPLFPLAKADTNWNHLIHTGEFAIVYQSLYGTHSTDLKKRTQEEAVQFGLSLKACDNSVATARIHGLYFADRTAVAGESYVYVIHIPGATNYSVTISVDGKLSAVHIPDSLNGKFKSRSVMLSFNILSSREDAAGYIIERSEDSVHYSCINDQLLIFTISQYETAKSELNYRDSFPANGKTYWYRIKTLSYFGIESKPSNVISGHGKDEWIIYPIIDSLYSSDNKTTSIKWKLSEPAPADLKTIILLRAPKAEGPYAILDNSVDMNNALIKDEKPLMSNYYMLCAISSENDSSFSYPEFLPLKDETPPGIPSGLSGTIDTNGIVKLKWNPVNDADVKGYRVFRCNSTMEEQIEITDSLCVDTEFKDSITLNTLTRSIYYSIRSVDRMYNNSVNSSPCRLIRPDKIPPAGIVPVNAFHTDSSIILQWRNSTSTDVAKKELIRSDGKSSSSVFRTCNDTISHYADTSIIAESIYSYSIILTDSSGNKTRTDFPVIQFSPRVLPSLENFSTEVDTMDRKIDLKWSAPKSQVDRYIIYRAKKGEQMRSWKTTNGNTNSAEDRTVYVGNTYEYAIKAVMKSGAETKMVKVEVEF